MQPPSCAASLPRGTGRIAMPRHYLYRGIHRNRKYGTIVNRGMPERRGRRQAFAPKSGNENFVSGYRTFGGWYIITYCFYFPDDGASLEQGDGPGSCRNGEKTKKHGDA